MPDQDPTPAAKPHPSNATDRIEKLTRLIDAQERRLGALTATVVRGTALVTVAVLLAGLILPFLVPRSGDGRSATLWQMLSEKGAPEVVTDPGGAWFIPIAATLLVIGVALSYWEGAERGWVLGVRRFLAVAYLIGCLLGFVVLGNYDESPRPAGAPPGLVTLTIGAVLAVALSYSRAVGDLRRFPGDPFR